MSANRLGWSVGMLLALCYCFAYVTGEAVQRVQVNTDQPQILSNKTLDSSNTSGPNEGSSSAT